MSARFLAVACSLLIGFIFIVPGTRLHGQDEHLETDDAPHETVEAHQGENEHGEATDEEFNATEYILDHISDSH
ncbi:MAG: hypothetical protein U9R60_07525, partial [Bacteroidota bacterium]|nr:hypothetical protein [Bacteroidota bacterium]